MILRRMTELLKQNVEVASKANIHSEKKQMGDHVKRIFFVRHGETDFNTRKCVQGRGIDSLINEEGRRQASFK